MRIVVARRIHYAVVDARSGVQAGVVWCSVEDSPGLPDSARTLVFHYLDSRNEWAGAGAGAREAQLASRVEELTRELAALRSYAVQLQETVRTLELGFRRHGSERIDPGQLSLAWRDGAASDGSTTDDAKEALAPDPDTADSSTPNAELPSSQDGGDPPKKRRRHRHGRGRIGVIPRVVVELLPPEVQLHGLAAYEIIGQDDTHVLGHRRGGPLEVVYRRLKVVPRGEGAPHTESGPVPSADGNVAPDGGSPSGVSGAARGDGAGRAGHGPAARGAASVTVWEHDVLTAPADMHCRHNPFVDGALVRFLELPAADEPTGPVRIAPVPLRPLERGMADASLLAHLFVGKLGRHMPYYRQEAELAQFGWPIARANMTRWQYECGGLVKPLVDRMWQQALGRDWFATDAAATAIRGSPKLRKGHVFVLVAAGQSILFRFSPTYDGPTMTRLFGGTTATIVADASANHNVLFGPGKAVEAGCWSHARRRFVAAFRAGEGAETAGVLRIMQSLFRLEREFATLPPAQRLEARCRQSQPLVEPLLAQAAARRHELPSDSLTRQGFVYLDNQRAPLTEFLRNGSLPMHNNVSERELRRHVKGRINWLFHGSDEHAESACALSSLVASAELHGLDPEFYLQEVLTVLPSYPIRRVLELSPELWLETRQRLILEGRLRYIDLARLSGSTLAFRPRDLER